MVAFISSVAHILVHSLIQCDCCIVPSITAVTCLYTRWVSWNNAYVGFSIFWTISQQLKRIKDRFCEPFLLTLCIKIHAICVEETSTRRERIDESRVCQRLQRNNRNVVARSVLFRIISAMKLMIILETALIKLMIKLVMSRWWYS